MNVKTSWLVIGFCGVLTPPQACANVTLPAIFSDHMVLQQDMKVPVWGTAAPGEAVTITFNGQTVSTKADSDGKWRDDLQPMATSATPEVLSVAGKNTVKFEDVLVGEVWVCSGQSNMEFSLNRADNEATEIPKANEPLIRLCVVACTPALDPQSDGRARWSVCSPATVANFTAVGYFFGREISHALSRPVGLIEATAGGMPAQAFTSLSGLQKDPAFTAYIDMLEQRKAAYPKALADFPKAQADYAANEKEWQATVGVTYNPLDEAYKKQAAEAQAKNLPLPPEPVANPPRPRPPEPPYGPMSTPTALYNGIICPFIPYAIRGAIWYQGEANAAPASAKNPVSPAFEYRRLFPRMITDWREKWGEGDFPFLFVQLANLSNPQKNPVEYGPWPTIRESQLLTLSLPNTGMSTATDIGDPKSIHPRDKIDVGLRLAVAAKHVAYGQPGVYAGPTYDSMAVEGGKIRVKFKNTGSGLKIGAPPTAPYGAVPTVPAKLAGFAIASADKQWIWADAQIDGDSVVVSSAQVLTPVGVRYGWAACPILSLYSMDNLPASPFRTDDWPEPAPGVPAPAPQNKPAAPATAQTGT